MLALAVSLAAAFLAQEPPPASTFASPSGAWTLTVTRPEHTWNGVVELVLAHDGAETWRATHELGLREACVGDDGRVAAYGYVGADLGEFTQRPDGPRGETLRTFVLDASGALLAHDDHARSRSPYPDGSPVPCAAGAFLTRDRLVVRVPDEDVNRGAEAWWSYDLVTGASRGEARPKQVLELAGFARILAARALPGTPLVLVHWDRSGTDRSHGSTFQLLDGELHPAWTLDLPHELDSLKVKERLALEQRGRIVSVAPAAFTLRLDAGATLASFSVAASDGSWTVVETSRALDPESARARRLPR